MDQIDKLKKELDTLRPLVAKKAKELESIFQAEQTEYIYESNAIEGNTLTLSETEIVLSKGLTISGKPLNDHLEAKNQKVALERLKELVSEEVSFSEKILLELHGILLQGIDQDWAGRYRNVPVRISGSRHIPPNPVKVPDLMTSLFQELNSNKTEHPVYQAADLHLKIAQIHPFLDGNGRLSRLIMNLHLIKNGYPICIIHSENKKRSAYYEALAESDSSESPNAFRDFIKERVQESLIRFLDVLRHCE